MADFFRDPDYPDRPQHPDYWRLVDVVNKHDGDNVEGGQSVEDIAGKYVDPTSLEYMAMQRAKVLVKDMGLPAHPFVAALSAVFIDSFCLGVAFEQAGGHRDTEGESAG